MEQKKVFPTACFGFDKKVVLDYIYEQGIQEKAKEAEYDERTAQLESQIGELQSAIEDLNSQHELLKAQLYHEKEEVTAQRTAYDKLRSDADQLVQLARNKDNELQIQVELNKQMQNKSSDFEARLNEATKKLQEAENKEGSVAEMLEKAARDADTILENARRQAKELAEKAVKATTVVEDPGQVAKLKEELNALKASVSKTLAAFEENIGKLGKETQKPAEPTPPQDPSHDPYFFRGSPTRK